MFINYVISIKKKLKPKQTYIERSFFHCAWYLRVNWPHCEGTPLMRCETVLEEAASQVGADPSPWSTSKDTSSSLLEELVVTVCWWRAIDFILRIYTNLYEYYIINFDYLKKIRQSLLYIGRSQVIDKIILHFQFYFTSRSNHPGSQPN